MSNLRRAPLHDHKNTKYGVTGSSVPRSPRLKERHNAIVNYSHSDSNPDSSINSDLEQDSEDENNSAKARKGKGKKVPKGKTERLYPRLPVDDDDEEEDNGGKQKGGKSKETLGSGGSKRNADNSQDERDLPQGNGATKREKSGSSFNLILIVGVGVVVIILAVFARSIFRTEEAVQYSRYVDHYKIFKQEMEPLRSQFPAQTDRFWRIVVSALKHVLVEDPPTYPAIVLFSVPQNQPKLGLCLSKNIIQRIKTVLKVTGDSYIDGTKLDDSSPGRTKLDLDQRLHAVLNSSKTVILDHLEKLPAEAALLLHAYCDGDNAPYKKAVIFLVLHTPRRTLETEKRTDESVEQILVDLWKAELGEDEMPALQSRIANNIAIMNQEKSDICK